jgi:hypothetical protein
MKLPSTCIAMVQHVRSLKNNEAHNNAVNDFDTLIQKNTYKKSPINSGFFYALMLLRLLRKTEEP